jgi:hypothetical protein
MAKFRTENSHIETEDVEIAIRRAKRLARSVSRAAEVYETETNQVIALVLPSGQVDMTWEGSRYVTAFELAR